jgi:hypothetical protein
VVSANACVKPLLLESRAPEGRLKAPPPRLQWAREDCE